MICLLGPLPPHPTHLMALLYTVVSQFEGDSGGAGHAGGGGGHAGGGGSGGHAGGGGGGGSAIAGRGTTSHYCTRVGFVQGVTIGRKKSH